VQTILIPLDLLFSVLNVIYECGKHFITLSLTKCMKASCGWWSKRGLWWY